MSQPAEVVVVGGGIVGLCSAWYLQRAGWQVTVLDRGGMGAACSHANCGLVCPSHVLPLAEPGAISAALKALLKPASPFRIRPRLDPSLWAWLWSFARRCNQRSMLAAARGIQPLLESGMHEYRQWAERGELECEWQSAGLLFVYQHAAELEKYAATDRLLSEHFHEPAQKLSPQQALALEPALRETIAGGWYYPHDAHLRPDVLIASLREQLLAAGVQLIEHCHVANMHGSGQHARQLETSRGEYTADAFVFACGAWSPQLHALLGCGLPIQPGKGYSITTPRPDVCPRIPLIFPEHRVAVTPMRSGYRLGSIMEFAGYDESITPARLDLLRRGAAPYLREPLGKPELETWYGWRPMTPDSLPIIDRTPRWGNAFMATGHNMLGLSMAPATGKLIAELVSQQTPHLDPAPYRASRFRISHSASAPGFRNNPKPTHTG